MTRPEALHHAKGWLSRCSGRADKEMCKPIQVYSGDTLLDEFDDVESAVDLFGSDLMHKHYGNGIATVDPQMCLCPLRVEALCAEAGYTVLPPEDPRWSPIDTAIERKVNHRDELEEAAKHD